MSTRQKNRLTMTDQQRLLLPDGNYLVVWNAGPAGKVGELRDWQGKLVSEFEQIPIIRRPKPEPKYPHFTDLEPKSPWWECLLVIAVPLGIWGFVVAMLVTIGLGIWRSLP